MTFREETLSKEALKALKNAKNKSDFLRSAVEFYVGFKDGKTHTEQSNNGAEFESLKSLVYELIGKIESNSDIKRPLLEAEKKHVKQERQKKVNVVESVVIPMDVENISISSESNLTDEKIMSFASEKIAVEPSIKSNNISSHQLSEVEQLVSNSIFMFGADDDDE